MDDRKSTGQSNGKQSKSMAVENEQNDSSKTKNRGKKRKRKSSDSSTDIEDVLPENTLEIEKNLHASAVKNNLDDTSVRKILKKVVTNDHVLALVKLREEEECCKVEDKSHIPKLTRSKAKELSKGSPKSAPWDLQNLELTPINHIPVKTRPEVKALIAQELPDDEDDDEYQPTHDDVGSDDDHTLESCSDLDSLPRTPATPSSVMESPKVVKDGPFKVPQEMKTPSRRKLEIDEAMIALRTRSKLSLSETPIEHIESSFVPPDELPMPVVDDLWNDFLAECLNPASTTRNEEDDEADPEYNVAADPDANDIDDLESSIIKISKKELNDLVTELFNIMPEDTSPGKKPGKEIVASKPSIPLPPGHWEGKQEPESDDEPIAERTINRRVSIGKTEPDDLLEEDIVIEQKTNFNHCKVESEVHNVQHTESSEPQDVKICIVEQETPNSKKAIPPPILNVIKPKQMRIIHVHKGIELLPEQRQIVEQQLRQHIQLAASNFLQLCVHPLHWSFAPSYKEYLETFVKLAEKNNKSIVNVCNLMPAWELITAWEKTVSKNTPDNLEMVNFIQEQIERNRRRSAQNWLYAGEFHERFKQVIANSGVFLYPHLLPPIPYRSELARKFSYLRSEDELITLYLDEFWQYVEDNPEIYKPPSRFNPLHRWGLAATVNLVCTHALHWLTPKMLLAHISLIRRKGDNDNPIKKFFKNREVTPVKHKLLPFNPKLTLYEQSEQEIPRLWIRYLSKTSKRFTNYLFRPNLCKEPQGGVPVEIGSQVQTPIKEPLPICFTKEINCPNILMTPVTTKPSLTDRIDVPINKDNTKEDNEINKSTQSECDQIMNTNIHLTNQNSQNDFSIIPDGNGQLRVPVKLQTHTVNSTNRPITSTFETGKVVTDTSEVPMKVPQPIDSDQRNCEKEEDVPNQMQSIKHCECCIKLRKISRIKQRTIFDYIKAYERKKTCPCKEERRYPKYTNKLRILVNLYKTQLSRGRIELNNKIKLLKINQRNKSHDEKDAQKYLGFSSSTCELDDLAYVMSYYTRFLIRTGTARNNMKLKTYNIFKNFNIETGCPKKLSNDIYKAFGIEMFDLYREFISFLNPQQADEIDRYKDYFLQNCLTELIKKIEEEVSNEKKRLDILLGLRKVLDNSMMSACKICSHLLGVVEGYPKLASYVFSIFPHKQIGNTDESKPVKMVAIEKLTSVKTDDKQPAANETTMEVDDTEMENEELEINDDNDTAVGQECIRDMIEYDDDNQSSSYEESLPDAADDRELCYDEQKEINTNIDIEETTIKTEPVDWSRDEDKLILTVLKECLSPKDKTIFEIIADNNIIDTISSGLTNKSHEDVRNRVAYIIELLVLSEC